MNLEIRKPELLQRVHAHIKTGQFRDADDVLEKALNALDHGTPESEMTNRTGSVILAALRASPYPEIDLTPPKAPLTSVRNSPL